MRQDAVVRYGIFLPNFGSFGSARVIADLAVQAESAGWDGVFVWDHVVRREGDLDLVDPWIALAAAACATERIRLGPLVTPLPRRRPWNVAKSAASLDQLSAGRVVLGVGLGTSRGPELPNFGEETDPRRRGDMLDESLAIVDAAWSGEAVRHAGEYYRVDDVRFLPRPVHGRIPIWAATEAVRGRPVRRAAGLDGIFPIGIEPTEMATLVGSLAAAGRDVTDPDRPYDIVVTDTTDVAARWKDTAVTWWLRQLAWDRPPTDALATVAAGPPAGD
jgi:alkanesulfonate monooxygenase SsuD/methylene tetrahydromethanopterin reductase-like flavin-dependent oxidoreductase (luciferase family)